jgi:hypothetical protein
MVFSPSAGHLGVPLTRAFTIVLLSPVSHSAGGICTQQVSSSVGLRTCFQRPLVMVTFPRHLVSRFVKQYGVQLRTTLGWRVLILAHVLDLEDGTAPQVQAGDLLSPTTLQLF